VDLVDLVVAVLELVQPQAHQEQPIQAVAVVVVATTGLQTMPVAQGDQGWYLFLFQLQVTLENILALQQSPLPAQILF
jgi:hypothetical protein